MAGVLSGPNKTFFTINLGLNIYILFSIGRDS